MAVRKDHDPLHWFDSSPEVIRLVVMTYVRYPLSLLNVEEAGHDSLEFACYRARTCRQASASI